MTSRSACSAASLPLRIIRGGVADGPDRLAAEDAPIGQQGSKSAPLAARRAEQTGLQLLLRHPACQRLLPPYPYGLARVNRNAGREWPGRPSEETKDGSYPSRSPISERMVLVHPDQDHRNTEIGGGPASERGLAYPPARKRGRLLRPTPAPVALLSC